MPKPYSLSPALLITALALAAAQACAAPPDAGRVSQEPRAPLQAPNNTTPVLKIDGPTGQAVPEGGPTIRLKGLRFQGNSAFDSATLQQWLADALERDLSFAELTRLAQRVTQRYREAGYLIARAYLPAQELKDGVLNITVLEGRLGQIELRNPAALRGSALSPLQRLPQGEPVKTQSLDPALLLLSDLPGTTVQSTLRPGQAVGASDLLVEVSTARRFEASVDADNFGSTYTGEYRAGASLYWNNPLDRGDQLSLRVQASNDRLHYERLAYQLPIGVMATRLGVAVANMSYRLGKDFAALDASGTSRVASVYLRQALLRSLSANWYGQVQLDAKRLRDDVGSTATTARQSLHNIVAGFNGDWRDGWATNLNLGAASNALQATVTGGTLSLDAASAALDAVSANTAGNFTKLELEFQRVQALRAGWSLALNLRGQITDKNLPSVEKFSLGGSQGVRAYAQGEGLGDRGWLASAELRWSVAPGWQVQAFGDAGGVQVNHRPWYADSNHRRLAGVGLGASWMTPRTAITFNAAWATDRESPTPQPDRQPRIWVQASLAF